MRGERRFSQEALAINTLAPFVLNSRLKPLLTPPRYRSGTAGDEHADEQQGQEGEREGEGGGGGDEGDGAVASYVINVSAMEGKFYRKKTVRTEQQLTQHDIKRCLRGRTICRASARTYAFGCGRCVMCLCVCVCACVRSGGAPAHEHGEGCA